MNIAAFPKTLLMKIVILISMALAVYALCRKRKKMDYLIILVALSTLFTLIFIQL